MSKENLKQKQKIESKQRLLNVASRLFKKNGYVGTGIDQIMQEAGLTAGAFYAHFRSKEDLFEQVLEHSIHQFKKIWIKDLENIEPAKKNDYIISKYVSFLHRDFSERGCVLPSVASEICRSSNKAGGIASDFLQEWAFMLMQNMSGDLSEKNKKQKAYQLISMAVGAVLLSRVSKNYSISDEIIEAVSTDFLNHDKLADKSA